MQTRKANLRNTAIAALLSLPLASGAVFAQQSNDTTGAQDQTTKDQSAQTGTTGTEQNTAQDQSSQSGSATGQSAGTQQEDSVVATVGDAEIRGSDIMTFIGMLPPQLRQQQPQMLVPIALEQLILRELVLQEAQSENLAEDPEVIALVDSSAQTAQEDAMVQVWLDRRLSGAVTDEAVQKVYDDAKAQETENLPPLETVRPQIERHLRQQAMQQLGTELRQGADIVLYDPTGQAMQQGGGATSGQSSQESGSAGNSDAQSSGTDSSGAESGND